MPPLHRPHCLSAESERQDAANPTRFASVGGGTAIASLDCAGREQKRTLEERRYRTSVLSLAAVVVARKTATNCCVLASTCRLR